MTDRITVRLVVGLLGLLAITLDLSAVWLLSVHVDVPDALWLAAGTAQGALGSLLVSTRSLPADVEEKAAPND